VLRILKGSDGLASLEARTNTQTPSSIIEGWTLWWKVSHRSPPRNGGLGQSSQNLMSLAMPPIMHIFDIISCGVLRQSEGQTAESASGILDGSHKRISVDTPSVRKYLPGGFIFRLELFQNAPFCICF